MNPITRLFERLGLLHSTTTPRKYALDGKLETMLESMAENQQCSPDEVAADLINQALLRQQVDTRTWRNWRLLSPREQQVTALTCLNYTNPQIAARLGLSVETIRSHSRSAQIKFDVHSKTDLRLVLSDWDFSEWEKQSYRY